MKKKNRIGEIKRMRTIEDIKNEYGLKTLVKADLSGANLSKTNLEGANLEGAKLSWADLSRANLKKVNLSRVNLSGANLSGANLYEVDLCEDDLEGANLSGANLKKANLERANLSDANLREANLSEANLSWTDLEGADLEGANLANIITNNNNISGLITLTGSKHKLVYYDNILWIGCIQHPLNYWLKYYMEIGKENNYTNTEIKEYKKHIDYIKQYSDYSKK